MASSSSSSSSLSVVNATNDISTATTTTSINRNKPVRNVNKMNIKKINEVKEVIQNRPNDEIQIVLSYYDLNVSKTINAFLNDEAKEILKNVNNVNGHSINNNDNNNNNNNNNNNQQDTQQKQNLNKKKLKTNTEHYNGSVNVNGNSTTTTNKLNVKLDKNNNINHNNKAKLYSINDLVDSVISKYTTTATPTPTISNGVNVSTDVNNTNGNSIIDSLLQKLSLSAASASSSSSSTVNNTNNTNTTTNVTNNNNVNTSQINDLRPNSLDIKQDNNHLLNSTTTTTTTVEVSSSYEPTRSRFHIQSNHVNINAKRILEKSQKDLQRQIVSLNRLASNFDEEIDKGQKMLRDLFNNLRTMIDDREIQLQHELDHLKSHGNDLFTKRQKKATEFKYDIERAEYLNDSQVQELKADIKHFVSERKIDEELGMSKRFTYDIDNIKESIQTFGQIIKINSHYALQRPSISELSNEQIITTPVTTSTLSPSSTMITTSTLSSTTTSPSLPINDNHEINNINKANLDTTTKTTTIVNGDTKLTNENGFSETKKPQRNRNRQNIQTASISTETSTNNSKMPVLNSTNGDIYKINGNHRNSSRNTRNSTNRTSNRQVNNNNYRNYNGDAAAAAPLTNGHYNKQATNNLNGNNNNNVYSKQLNGNAINGYRNNINNINGN